jgi:hypothetical protein
MHGIKQILIPPHKIKPTSKDGDNLVSFLFLIVTIFAGGIYWAIAVMANYHETTSSQL